MPPTNASTSLLARSEAAGRRLEPAPAPTDRPRSSKPIAPAAGAAGPEPIPAQRPSTAARHHAVRVAPESFNPSISSQLNPADSNISSVCIPSGGPAPCTRGGVADMWIGNPGTRIRPR